MTHIPTIDFERRLTDKAEYLKDLRDAARHVGFFYLANPTIDVKLLRTVRAFTRLFFMMKPEQKLEVEMIHSPHFRGYNRTGVEITKGAQDWREQFDMGPEELAVDQDEASWLSINDAEARLRGPNQWPSAFPALKKTMLTYQRGMSLLAAKLLSNMAEALEQPANVFASIYEPEPHTLMKLIRYPAMPGSGQGVGSHKDYGFLTLIMQDFQGATNGLQVLAENGEWIDAPPRPGTFIVNIGEALEMASDGYLKATVHRVVTPTEADRYSVAYFMDPRLDREIPKLILPPHLAAEVRGVTTDPDNPLFKNFGKNFLKGRLRSHPDVAQRWHGDLL